MADLSADNQNPRFPEIVTFRITSSCLNDCTFCYGPKNIPELTFAEVTKIFDLIKIGGAKGIVLTGGDPLLRIDIDKILMHLNAIALKIYLDTSGENFFRFNHLINKTVADLGIPLDAAGVTGAYRRKSNYLARLRILEYYKNLRSLRPRIKIGTVVTNENIEHLEKIGRLLCGYNIDKWKLYQFIPIGINATQHQNDLLIDDDRFLDCAFDLKNRFQDHFEVVVSPRSGRANAYFLINPDGNVIMPEDDRISCSEKILGHIFDDQILKRYLDQIEPSNYHINIKQTFETTKAHHYSPKLRHIYHLAKQHYWETNSYVMQHIDWMLEHSFPAKSTIDAYEDFLLLIILHDIGYFRTHRNPFLADSRLWHMKAGVGLSKEIMLKAKIHPIRAKRIAKLVGEHDLWAFGEDNIYKNNPILGIFHDLHYSSMLEKNNFRDLSTYYNDSSNNLLDYLIPKNENHHFYNNLTKNLHLSLLRDLRYELLSSQ